jgi:hypothetical protein
MREESRTGPWGQTRQANFPLESRLKEPDADGEEDEEEVAAAGSMRSSRRRLRCCDSRDQLSPPNTLMPAFLLSSAPPEGGCPWIAAGTLVRRRHDGNGFLYRWAFPSHWATRCDGTLYSVDIWAGFKVK